jgi:hypothetical protein
MTTKELKALKRLLNKHLLKAVALRAKAKEQEEIALKYELQIRSFLNSK